MSLSVTIAGNSVSIIEGSFKVQDYASQASASFFKVRDDAGTADFQFGMPVVASDSTNGNLFVGFVNQADRDPLPPKSNKIVTVQCMDNSWIPSKRRCVVDYTNMAAGDITLDLLSRYLAGEGITAGYAYQRVSTNTEWSGGTLTGTASTTNVGDGDLELATAGSTASTTFPNTSWSTGATLTSIDVQNTMLNLHASNALKYTGTCIGNLGNTYAYWEIWAGSYTIASGDMLQYDVWISSTSPEMKAAVDLTMTDGNTMRDFSGQACHDNFNIHAHPGSDLKGFADDQWYSRTVQLTALNGKTTSFATIAFEGDTGGSYTAYFKNIKIVNSSFVTQATLYDGTSNPYQPYLVAIGQNYVVGNNGYINLNVGNTTVYDISGTWLSPAISIDAAKLIKSSLVSWASSIPTGATPTNQTSGSNAPLTPQGTTISVYTSIDNKATWQLANYKSSIPNLDAGFNVAGRNLYVKVVLAIANPSPEVSPILKSLQITVNSSWTQTKTDSITTAATQTDFNTGNYTGAGWQTYLSGSAYSMDNGVSLAGYIDSWDYAATLPTNITLYSTSFVTGAVYLNRKQLNLPLGTGTDIRARVDAFGSNGTANYQNFSAQVSFSFPDVSIENGAGLAYRTTNWGNNNDSYAYAASMITNKGHGSTPNTGNTVLELSKGTNSTGAGGYTNLGSFTLPFTPANGTTYTLKIVINGSTHKLYIDGVLYLTVTDATYSAAGQIAVRYYNNTGATQTAIFDNFGVVALQPVSGVFSGQWDNGTGISLGTGIGTVGNSLIAWDTDEPAGTAITCSTSVDGGSTWQSATNGGAIPNLPAGTNTNGKSVRVKFALISTYPSITPVLKGWTIWLTTATNASGTWKSAQLSMTTIGRIASTSIGCNSAIPTSTGVALDASFDGTSWTPVQSSLPTGYSSNPVPVALIYPQPDPVLDFFNTNTSANYTSSAGGTGAATATWTFNIGDPRNYLTGLQGSGKQGILLYNTFVSGHADIYCEADINYSDAGGIIIRAQDSNNFYFISIRDSQSSSVPNTVTIRKVVTGTLSTVAGTQTTISFTRGDWHRFRFQAVGSTLTVYMDNKQIVSATDTSLPNAGKCGFICGVAVSQQIQIYSFRMQNLGDIHDGQNIYPRLTLTSTDPTVTPQIGDITIAIRNANIGTGLSPVASTNYAANGSQRNVAQALDDLASQSSTSSLGPYAWKIDLTKALQFHHSRAVAAPFYVYSDSSRATPDGTGGNILFASGYTPTVSRPDLLYRNRQTVDGGVDTTSTDTRSFAGDGQTQSWTLPYNVNSINSITLDGVTQQIGIQGTDTGKDFYYTVGSPIISQDASETAPASTSTLTIAYVPQIPVRVTLDNTGVENPSATPYPTVSLPGTVTQSQLAAIDHTLGIVEGYISDPTLTKAGATALARSLLQQYGFLGRTFTWTTLSYGLAPGQLVNITAIEFGLYNVPMLVTQVTTEAKSAAVAGGVLYYYTISATEGAILGDWSIYLTSLATGKRN